MAERDPSEWMWERAAELLERADKAQKRFFQLHPGAPTVAWEPPIDVFENERELAILVALPGVREADLEIVLERDRLLVRAQRRIGETFAACAVRRLEIPQGRFERRIPLAPGRYVLAERALVDGCLSIRLEKVY